MKKIFLSLVSVVAMLSFYHATSAADLAAQAVILPDSYATTKTYKFDTKAVTALVSGSIATLEEITCPRDDILKTLGLLGTLGANRKRTNLTYEDTQVQMFVSYDLIGCHFNAYAVNIDYQNKQIISENNAIAAAKKFLAEAPFKDIINSSLGEPLVVGKYNAGNPMPYPIADLKNASQEHGDEDYIDTPTYTNYTILFPYIIGGKKVYYNYGGRAGVSVEVTAEGVVSYYGQFLSLPGVAKKAKSMSTQQVLTFVKRGGNNPYYGEKKTIHLGTPEKVLVLVNDWRNNKNTLYLASGIRLPSTLALDEYNPWNTYEMIIVDYAFANQTLTPYK